MLNLLNLLQSGSTMAYIDPAATSVLLSSITAIVVAIGASAIIFWRRFKKKVSKTLHIDPNGGKEVEDDVQVSDKELLEEQTAEKTAETTAETKQTTEVVEAKETAEAEQTAETSNEEEAAETEQKPEKKKKTSK